MALHPPVSSRLATLSALGALALAAAGLPLLAGAQTGTGTVNGRVAWCVAGPFPLAPGVGAAEAAPDGTQTDKPETQPMPSTDLDQLPGTPAAPDIYPGIRPAIPRPLPAGAVLVALQGTDIHTTTDANGRFSLTGVPAGPYLTVGAGPVTSVASAGAMRPNVLVTVGQQVDVGTLYLSASSVATCRAFPGVLGAESSPAESLEP